MLSSNKQGQPSAKDVVNKNAPKARAPEHSAILNVEQSCLSKHWAFTEYDERNALHISQAYKLPEVVSRVLSARGISFDDVPDFLEPTLKSMLPNPNVLKDMEKSAIRIAKAIMNGEKVAIFGDYDVDGATSTGLFKRFFDAVGDAELTVYIPDRIVEGYGPNAPALLKLGESGHKIIITVDCGVTSFEPLQAAADAGIEVIVLDHHAAEPNLPTAYAVVNPNRLDEDGSLGNLAAVGVSFLAIVAINRELRAQGWYKKTGRREPPMTQWLDIVALGTVCDVVPLTGVNRAFVTQGLKVMAMRRNVGLTALSDVAGIDDMPNAFHAGFILGPRINAGGRVGKADLGTQLLSTYDRMVAHDIAHQLHEYNKERQEIEKDVLEQAIEQVENELKTKDKLGNIIVVSGENWHAGVIGIVASRIKEKYNRPVCVITIDDNGMCKGSGRSISGIDLGAMVISARQNDILTAGGGHKMAAGFSLAQDNIDSFRGYLNERIDRVLGGKPMVAELRVDGVLSAHGVNLGLVKQLDKIAPFGAGNAEPRFVLNAVRIVKPSVIGADQSHVKCFIQDTSGGKSIAGIAFRVMDTPLGDVLLKSGDAVMHLAGYVRVNRWNGYENVQFQIVDAAPIW